MKILLVEDNETLAKGLVYSLEQDKYNVMVEWLKNKSASQSRKACEIVISYYIQDCEVFEK